MPKTNKNDSRIYRKQRIRKKLSGTSERPRLTVYKSLHHMYAQIIDDSKGHTLAFASTLDKVVKEGLKKTANKAAAVKVGEVLAKVAKEKNITKVAFDKNGYKYDGRVKALADAARKGGLTF